MPEEIEQVVEPVEPDIEIETVDDRPPEDRRAPAKVLPSDPTDDELASLTKGKADRIKEITYARHEERRAKEAAIRERDATLEFARAIHQQLEIERNLGRGFHQQLVQTAALSKDNETEAAKAELTRALDGADVQKIADATAKMSRIAAEKQGALATPPPMYPNVQLPPPAPAAQQAPPEGAISWAKSNAWYTDPQSAGDRAMKHFANETENALLKRGSDPYDAAHYAAIDKALRDEFPHKFTGDPAPIKNGVVAAPARVSSAVTPPPRKIQLTASQVKVAEALKPSYMERDAWLKAYARQIKEQR